MKLENKVAYITGGDGMGRQIALQYAKEGAKIGFITRSAGSADETVRLLTEMGAEVVYTLGDVSDEEVLLASMKKTEEAFGLIDIVVNNVGMDIFKHFHELESAEWDKIFNVNLKAAFLTSKYALSYVNSIVETIPAKRIGQVQDIANMAVFLASDEASYVNGDVIAVDGGLSLA